MSMFLHLSRLQRWDLCCCINNTAWYCPGGSLLCVSGSCLFSLICYAVYPNTERGAFQALRVADAATHRDNLHLLWEKDALVTQGAKDGLESACIYTFQLKSSESFHAGVGFHLFAHTCLTVIHEQKEILLQKNHNDFFILYTTRDAVWICKTLSCLVYYVEFKL